ncbi:MAG: hypothetical protein JWN70_892 [Planctomycetaceae bacterium]|nr:hypothetical protein [Planctomycetaceae bacterium]
MPPYLTDQELNDFLVSNDLWGGAGSIADEACVSGPRSTRRKIEGALIELGNAQIQSGLVNVRTESWVQAFEQWAESGT